MFGTSSRRKAPTARMTMSMDLGVDLGGVPSELPARLERSVNELGVQLIVAPLAHPRYRRDHKRPRTEPMTRSDMLLSSEQWTRHVVGKLSPWIQLDSPHPAVRARGETAFRAEIAWAAHLGLQAVLLPPPPADLANYARLVQWACLSTQHMQFLVRVPAGSIGDADDSRADTGGGHHGEQGRRQG